MGGDGAVGLSGPAGRGACQRDALPLCGRARQHALLGVGRGLPFWLSTALFIAAFVFLFRRANRKVGDATGSDRGDAVLAVVCGVATAAVVTLVFEQLFFVRLP